jgi:hypothetical protein
MVEHPAAPSANVDNKIAVRRSEIALASLKKIAVLHPSLMVSSRNYKGAAGTADRALEIPHLHYISPMFPQQICHLGSAS